MFLKLKLSIFHVTFRNHALRYFMDHVIHVTMFLIKWTKILYQMRLWIMLLRNETYFCSQKSRRSTLTRAYISIWIACSIKQEICILLLTKNVTLQSVFATVFQGCKVWTILPSALGWSIFQVTQIVFAKDYINMPDSKSPLLQQPEFQNQLPSSCPNILLWRGWLLK